MMRLRFQGVLSCIAVLLVLIMLHGCSATGSYISFRSYAKPLPGKIAQESIRYEGVERNPVIVIPGYVGSRLRDPVTGTLVWGEFLGKDAFLPMSRDRMQLLSLPMQEGKKIREIHDDNIVDGPLDAASVRIMGVRGHALGYGGLFKALSFGGYYSEQDAFPEYDYGKQYDTLFQFGYDWRCDLVANAAKLHAFIQEKRKYVQKQYEERYGFKDYDVQFDIVCHSMGGLLSRYYLRYGEQVLPEDGSLPELTWAGSRVIDKVVIVGTPNAGYTDAFIELLEGMRISPGTPLCDAAVIGTFASIYQMLPLSESRSVVYGDKDTGEEVDLFDPEVWIAMQWGLANPHNDSVLKKILPEVADPKRRREIAIDHLRKCLNNARQFTDSLRFPATPPEDVALYLFCGAAIRTADIVSVDRNTGAVKIVTYGPGDGKVLASSARFDERTGGRWEPTMPSPIQWSAVYHLFDAHMGLTSDKTFLTNLFYILLYI